MKMTKFTKLLSLLLCMVLVAAMTLTAVGCGDKNPGETTAITEGAVFGSGAVEFTFIVTDKAGGQTSCTVKTDKTTVGDALLEHNLIAGENGQYGLYIKTVNGITADYDTDGTYWAFYIGGEYATSGIDMTNVEAGATYELRVES